MKGGARGPKTEAQRRQNSILWDSTDDLARLFVWLGGWLVALVGSGVLGLSRLSSALSNTSPPHRIVGNVYVSPFLITQQDGFL